MSEFTIWLPAAAVSAILPPSASISPVLVTSCDVIWSETATSIRSSPYISTVAVSPEASCIFPSFAVMVPLLITLGATNPTSPASFAVIVPLLTIAALGLPGLSKVSVPPAFMKASLPISAVVAMRPLTSTLEPAPKTTPFWLMMTMLPLAVRLPSIWLALVLLTRFSAMELLEG